MEILFSVIIVILAAQLGVLGGIFLKIGGVQEALKNLRNRVEKIEKGIDYYEVQRQI